MRNHSANYLAAFFFILWVKLQIAHITVVNSKFASGVIFCLSAKIYLLLLVGKNNIIIVTGYGNHNIALPELYVVIFFTVTRKIDAILNSIQTSILVFIA